ncbi:hypothetical protein ACVA51_13720 [Pseudomonas luteola]
MSEREDFNAWLKTWALPGNTSREDAMYAAWQARAARTASAEPVAWVIDWPDEPELGHYFSESADTISGRSRPLYTAPDALQAENERLKTEVADLIEARDARVAERLAVLDGLRDENERLNKQVDILTADCASLRADRDAFGQNAIDIKAENERLKKFETAYMQWIDKTEWARALVEPKELGKHLADVMRERIERLREEVERLSNALEVAERSVENEVKRRNQYALESDELDRQVEALKADAERYRHMRENADTMHWENMLKADIETLEDIDAAIDAARTAKPEVKS